MKSLLVLMSLAAVLAVAGCEDPNQSKADFNSALVTAYYDAHVTEGVIRGHTLYPYHFVDNSAELNNLGQRDLAVLTDHFRTNPGQLNVRRGVEADDLYNARLQRVKTMLADGGVDSSRMKIADELAGGDGLPGTKVVEILQRESAESAQGSDWFVPMFSGGQGQGIEK